MPFKAFIVVLLMNMGATAIAEESIKRFLDSEQRPGAEVITPSSVAIELTKKETILVTGILGAIKANKNYVGFTGVSISSSQIQLQSTEDFTKGLHIKLKKFPEGDTVLSFSLEINEKVYTYDFNSSGPEEKELFIKAGDFEETFRGRPQGSFLDPSKLKDTSELRVFLKRSKNNPFSTEALPFQFEILGNFIFLRL